MRHSCATLVSRAALTSQVVKPGEAVPTMLAQRFFPDLDLDQVGGWWLCLVEPV